MLPQRNNSTIGTIIGALVFGVAIIGTVFFDWTWENEAGNLLPLGIGIAAAAIAVLIVLTRIRG